MKMSNLDDMHGNGIHDLSGLSNGVWASSDHASKDIRLGIMTREENRR